MRGLSRRAAAVAAAALITLAACGGGDGGGSADSKEEWEDEHGALVEAYSRDLSAALNTINQGERQNTINTCTQVKDDAIEVRENALPVPNSAVDAPLRSAVDFGIKAADSCLTGARNTDARAVEAAQRDFAEARQAMDEAETALKAWM
ncbi:MAG: hypothetical protein ACRD2W_12890 [Acidimicrobiales bacterium]